MIEHSNNCFCAEYKKLWPEDVIELIKENSQYQGNKLTACEMDTLANIVAKTNNAAHIYEWSEFAKTHRDIMFQACCKLFQVEHLVAWIMMNEITEEELKIIKNKAIILQEVGALIHDFTAFVDLGYFDSSNVSINYKDFLWHNLLAENFYDSLSDGAELGIII